MRFFRRRDLSVTGMANGFYTVIACDSCGGIGLKPNDVLQIAPYYVGRYSARVVLMEVMASGAELVSLCNAVCCEMNDTGLEIIRGVRDELAAAGVSDAVLTGSTEENFPTSMTAVGMTAIGIVEESKLRFGKCFAGDQILLVGVPKVGGEIRLDFDTELAQYQDIHDLLGQGMVREIVPVGSKGILFEAGLLADLNGLTVRMDAKDIDMNRSAGPATCMIAAASPEFDPLSERVRSIGRLV